MARKKQYEVSKPAEHPLPDYLFERLLEMPVLVNETDWMTLREAKRKFDGDELIFSIRMGVFKDEKTIQRLLNSVARDFFRFKVGVDLDDAGSMIFNLHMQGYTSIKNVRLRYRKFFDYLMDGKNQFCVDFCEAEEYMKAGGA